jgi:hypothetical protein
MNESASDNVILVSTETTMCKRHRLKFALVCWIPGLLLLSNAIWLAFAQKRCFSHPPLLQSDFWVAVLGAGLGSFVLIAPRFAVRGNWRLDDEGAWFVPLRGGATTNLPWREVEAVVEPSVRTRQLVLHTARGNMQINLWSESSRRQEEIMDFLRQKLGREVAILNRLPEPISIRRLLWISALTLTAGIIWLSSLVFTICYSHASDAWLGRLLLYWLVPLVPLFLLGIIAVRRENRKRWQLRR